MSSITELLPYAFEYTLYLAVGFLAGLINTLAGGGSVFTLSLLLFLGLPANVANGTNRLGILLQNAMGVYTFQRSGLLDTKASVPYVLWSLLGAMAGVLVAVDLSEETMKFIVGTLMIFMLLQLIFKPSADTKTVGISPKKKPEWLRGLIFFAIGFYGGFIQAGIGLVIIVALSQFGFSLIRGNAIKMVIICLYTIPVFGIFVYHGHVEWLLAAWLAAGQVLGTVFAAKLVDHPKVNVWMRYLLIGMVLTSILKMFDLHEYVLMLF